MYSKDIENLRIAQKNLMKIAMKTKEPLLIKDIEAISAGIRALKSKRHEELIMISTCLVMILGLLVIACIVY